MHQCCLSQPYRKSLPRVHLSSGQTFPQSNIFCIFFLRNYKTYIQAIGDLNNLFYSRVRNIFHQNDTIYSLSSNGRLADHACQLAHDHTGSVCSSCLPSLPRVSSKGLLMTSEADLGPSGPYSPWVTHMEIFSNCKCLSWDVRIFGTV